MRCCRGSAVPSPRRPSREMMRRTCKWLSALLTGGGHSSPQAALHRGRDVQASSCRHTREADLRVGHTHPHTQLHTPLLYALYRHEAKINALYKVPERLDVKSKSSTEEMLSNQMLSGIPEVDLGLE